MGTNVLITGAAGYIGTMLLEALGKVGSVDGICGIDIKERPSQLAACAKLRWFCSDVADDGWAAALRGESIHVVFHCAYQIRELYGRRKQLQRRWNVDGARKVFEFALHQPSVHRLVQLSTVSAYGAFATNSTGRSLDEDAALAEDRYLYGVQKREVETLLSQLYDRLQPKNEVIVLRLASVSGPRGRLQLNRYGLLSTVAGRFPFLVCGRKDWGRQYLHEDDLIALLSMLAQLPPASGYRVLNVSPPDYLDAPRLGHIFGKRIFLVPPMLLRTLFAVLWHGTAGAVTTPPGVWKFLSYPIRVDGSHLTRVYGYRYEFSSRQALVADVRRYAIQKGEEPGARADTPATHRTHVDGQTAD